MNVNLIKIINSYKNYKYFYKSLKGLVLNKGDFTTLPSSLKVVIIIFNLKILLEDKAISRVKREITIIKKNLVLKSRVFKINSEHFKYILEVTY
ncbi:hypothetical protein C8035_v009435 [Colletotrichum spinosum]|uniref:Uncharacterized protein n=1 Tax=Colletotrichum spinosum TaxID=1347390 RepID=A0A4R8PTL3_9PEZI|nr:hypothetical protein C8035_v009435 [Colletotrichum spinosum]